METTSPPTLSSFLELIKDHDYAYEYSENRNVFNSGRETLIEIAAQLDDLICVQGFSPVILLKHCLNLHPEIQNSLPTRIIHMLFKKYINN